MAVSAGSWYFESLSPEGFSVNLNSLSSFKIFTPFNGGVGEGELKFLKLSSGYLKVRSPHRLDCVAVSISTWTV